MSAIIEYKTSDDSDTANVIHFDGTARENHNPRAQVTEHAVEVGSNVSDHVRPSNDAVSLVVYVTNNPTQLAQSHSGGTQIVSQNITLPSGASATANGFSSKLNRVELVYRTLREVLKNGYLCKVITLTETYESMVLTDISAPITVDGGVETVEMTVSFKQVRLVRTENADAPRTEMIRAKHKARRGGNATDKASDDEAKKTAEDALASEGKSKSFALQLAGLVGS